MKRYIIFILFVGFFVFFQSTLFYSNLNIKGINPDFLLITLSITAFLLGPMPGQIFGFVTGLTVDILSGGILGISAFTFTAIGYSVGIVGGMVYGRNMLVSIILLFFVTIAKAALLSMLAAIFLHPGFFGYFSQGRIFLEAVINSLLTPPLFFIIMKLNKLVSE